MKLKSLKAGDPMAWKVVVITAFVAVSAQSLGKEEKAMFRAHSEACLGSSGVDPSLLSAMLAGQLRDDPALRKHVYCVLLRCKIIGKDGKLHKNAVLAKMSLRPDAKNATKILESCAHQAGDTPEDVAWNLFRCGYDRKALLFAYMPGASDAPATNYNESIN